MSGTTRLDEIRERVEAATEDGDTFALESLVAKDVPYLMFELDCMKELNRILLDDDATRQTTNHCPVCRVREEEVERLRAELAMHEAADTTLAERAIGAYRAQEKAEAENARLREALEKVRDIFHRDSTKIPGQERESREGLLQQVYDATHEHFPPHDDCAALKREGA